MRGALRTLTPYLALGTLTAFADESVAPYVPTVEEDVELMLEVAGVGPGDYVIDLGSGDGRIVISAARRGAHGHGVELEAELVELALDNARAAGVADRTAFVRGDVFAADIEAATVVTTYLFPEAMLALRPKFLSELRPGTRIVSNSFTMEEWLPDVHDMSARSSGGVLLWIVPAQLDGDWVIEANGERWNADVTQQFQRLVLQSPAGGVTFGEADLAGNRVAFVAEADDVRYRFSGHADGDTVTGYVQIADEGVTRVERWRAHRTPSP